nr:immunoglobulin light chain junction region [Macaca mulatta]MOW04594.1 immunoglobulin light chain junction region [Macaca mulatta]MOW04638.1 immunoglobulin light chain junction region [Macaca mulatta]MOW04902.1 immunoglobulin light chain junction region [Macaca mulatta]MOW04953.1 immunoglobulin light chain junction region [Macaca mulatta]
DYYCLSYDRSLSAYIF